jgi:hypothetical protein
MVLELPAGPTCAVTASMLGNASIALASAIVMPGFRRSGHVSSVPSQELTELSGRR